MQLLFFRCFARLLQSRTMVVYGSLGRVIPFMVPSTRKLFLVIYDVELASFGSNSPNTTFLICLVNVVYLPVALATDFFVIRSFANRESSIVSHPLPHNEVANIQSSLSTLLWEFCGPVLSSYRGSRAGMLG